MSGPAKDKPIESLVRAFGTGKMSDRGRRFPFKVKKGTSCSWPNMAARKSNWTGRNTESSVPTKSSRSSNVRQFSTESRFIYGSKTIDL
jgi:hypothetical protein